MIDRPALSGEMAEMVRGARRKHWVRCFYIWFYLSTSAIIAVGVGSTLLPVSWVTAGALATSLGAFLKALWVYRFLPPLFAKLKGRSVLSMGWTAGGNHAVIHVSWLKSTPTHDRHRLRDGFGPAEEGLIVRETPWIGRSCCQGIVWKRSGSMRLRMRLTAGGVWGSSSRATRVATDLLETEWMRRLFERHPRATVCCWDGFLLINTPISDAMELPHLEAVADEAYQHLGEAVERRQLATGYRGRPQGKELEEGETDMEDPAVLRYILLAEAAGTDMSAPPVPSWWNRVRGEFGEAWFGRAEYERRLETEARLREVGRIFRDGFTRERRLHAWFVACVGLGVLSMTWAAFGFLFVLGVFE